MMRRFLLVVVLTVASTVALVYSPALAIGATTTAATDITESGAVLNGSVTHGAGDYTVAYAVSTSESFSQQVFDYSSPCNTSGKVLVIRTSNGGLISAGTSNASFDFRSWTPCGSGSGLIPQTTYFVKVGIIQPDNGACVYDLSCYTWGNTVSFTTRAAVLPTATTGNAAEVGPDSAVLNASVVAADGKADVAFEYGTSPTLAGAKSVSSGQVNPAVGYSAGIPQPTIFGGTQKLAGLIEQTTYYYRVVATSTYGAVRGEIKSFTTKPPVGISINNAAEFTNSTSVSVSVSWPVNAESILISNDGGFRTQQAVALADNVSWTLTSSGDERLPKTVYLKFILADGSRSSVYADDIILDTTAPILTQATGSAVSSSTGVTLSAFRPDAKKNATRLRIVGKDGNSGIASVQIKTSAKGYVTTVPVNKAGVVSTTVIVKSTRKMYLVRMVDRAGNPAKTWRTVRITG